MSYKRENVTEENVNSMYRTRYDKPHNSLPFSLPHLKQYKNFIMSTRTINTQFVILVVMLVDTPCISMALSALTSN